MFCGNCGKELPDGSVFCLYCGTQLGNTNNNVNVDQNQNNQQYAPNGQPVMSNGQPVMPSGQPAMPNGQPVMPNGQQYTPNFQPINIAPMPGVDPNSEYEVYKGEVRLVKGGMKNIDGRMEVTNKNLRLYGRSTWDMAWRGVFALLRPPLQLEISVDDIVSVTRGADYILQKTFIITTKDNVAYRFGDLKVDYWIQLIQSLLYARDNKQ